MKIVVLDGYALNPGDLSWEDWKPLGELVVYDRTSPDELLSRAGDAEMLLTNKTVLGEAEIEALPALQYIGVLATGYNVVDLQAARKRGIVVTNIPAYSTESVAQMVFAHILNISQRAGHYAEEVHTGVWSRQADFCYWNTPLLELAGKRLGIVGLGHTGQAVARIALGFGMQVCACTSKLAGQLPPGVEKAVSVEELFSSCDIVSLHCPLTPDTAEMVNEFRLSRMKKGAILINTARGGLVNEADLAKALKEGCLLGAGLDVLSTEPPRPDNPLLGIPNCYITPHIAWATREARIRLMRQAVENLKAWKSGKTINNVIK
ncbi:D-2-hydroxyacid dehydrogenase [Phocaeicola coprophilus]|uniref:D-2-hydroxyacid dehydrogenase n=1 Tax=Phocaeicola coprophilus TaxID=387090 RepID=UPI00266C51DB|nr:D-2-hydroxyacid dehydrogenase [Phocaeicola coprophilus]